jgi:hypothetical protein
VNQGFLTAAEKNNVNEYDFFEFIVDTLRPLTSSKAQHFSNCLFLAQNKEVQFSLETPHQTKFKNLGLRCATAHITEEQANALFKAVLLEGEKNKAFLHIFDQYSRHFNNSLNVITIFYRNIAQPLFDLNQFHISESAKLLKMLPPSSHKGENFLSFFDSILRGEDMNQPFSNLLESNVEKESAVSAAGETKKKKKKKKKKMHVKSAGLPSAEEGGDVPSITGELSDSDEEVNEANIETSSLSEKGISVVKLVVDSCLSEIDVIPSATGESSIDSCVTLDVEKINLAEKDKTLPFVGAATTPLTKGQKKGNRRLKQ